MSLFGNVGMNVITQAVMAYFTGGASLLTQQLFSAIGQQVIQQLGRELGLSQSQIDFAQAAFSAQLGDISGVRQNVQEAVASIGQQLGLDARQQGDLARAGNDAVQRLVQQALEMIREGGGEESRASRGGGRSNGSGGGGDSILVAIAKALGKAIDDKLNTMRQKAEELGNLDSQDSKYGQLSAEIQALGQEISFLSQALTNTIKSIGEAATTLARKS